jgi:G3E family GTPase
MGSSAWWTVGVNGELDFTSNVRSTSSIGRQVACADVILLNKTDLVDEAKVREVEERIR